MLPLQRDGVVDEELRSGFENIWESIPGEVAAKRVRDVGEEEGSVSGQGFGDDGGKSVECMSGPTVTCGTVPLARTRTAVTESMLSLTRMAMLLL